MPFIQRYLIHTSLNTLHTDLKEKPHRRWLKSLEQVFSCGQCGPLVPGLHLLVIVQPLYKYLNCFPRMYKVNCDYIFREDSLK